MAAALPHIVPGQTATVPEVEYLVAQQDSAPIVAMLPPLRVGARPGYPDRLPELVRLNERLGRFRLGDVVRVKSLCRAWRDDRFGDWAEDTERWNSVWRAMDVERVSSPEEWTERAVVRGFSRRGLDGTVCAMDVELLEGHREVRFRKEDVVGDTGFGRFHLGMVVDVAMAMLPVECMTPRRQSYVVPAGRSVGRGGDIRVNTVARAVMAPPSEEELDEEADAVISRASTGLGWYSGLR